MSQASGQASAFLLPTEIRFTQSSIKDAFRNGLTLEETAVQLASKVIPKRNVEMISVVYHNGYPYSLDNRRLAVFRLLQFVGKCSGIKVRVTKKNENEWRRKFDPAHDHEMIVVRGNKYVIGTSVRDTSFPLTAIRAATALRPSTTSADGRELQEILATMDSDDEDSEPSARRAPVKQKPQRKKNASDPRRGGKSSGQLSFTDALEPFAAGKSRYAFRCRAAGGCVAGFTEGSYLVLKAFKPGFQQTLSHRDAQMQEEASKLAKLFNEQAQPTQNGHPCPIYIRDAAVIPMNCNLCDTGRRISLEKNQMVLVEREIFGEFRKFNSNNGWATKTGSEIPSAFSHWTWAKFDKLVCDLQGYQGKPNGPKYLNSSHYYLLTDPAIMTRDGRYGITDLGQTGIENWFAHHECNGICHSLGIAAVRPAVRRATMRVESSSSYRETDNIYGPRHVAAPSLNVMALGAIQEDDSDYSDDSDGYSLGLDEGRYDLF